MDARRVYGVDVEAVLAQLQVLDHLLLEDVAEVGTCGYLEAREPLLGHRGASDDVPALQYLWGDVQPGPSKVACGDQAVVPAANDDDPRNDSSLRQPLQAPPICVCGNVSRPGRSTERVSSRESRCRRGPTATSLGRNRWEPPASVEASPGAAHPQRRWTSAWSHWAWQRVLSYEPGYLGHPNRRFRIYCDTTPKRWPERSGPRRRTGGRCVGRTWLPTRRCGDSRRVVADVPSPAGVKDRMVSLVEVRSHILHTHWSAIHLELDI